MQKPDNNSIKSMLICVGFCALTGVFSALIITAFKVLAELVVHASVSLYSAVRDNPNFLPLLIIGAVVIGVVSSVIYSVSKSCRGGGIPTTIVAIRGIISFKWLVSLLLLPVASMLTFFAALPLGTEGPSVQMGTAVGDGVVSCFGRKNGSLLRREVMTAGAAAGFSIATVSPVSAIVFALEELHKKFSLQLLISAIVSVLFAQTTAHVLARFGIGSTTLFHISSITSLPIWQFFAPLIVGIVCGICSILFTKAYQLVDKLSKLLLKKLTAWVVFPTLFCLVAVVGFFLAQSLGSGHSLIDELFSGRTAWYILILIFLVRALATMLTNTAGITGGVFLPTLALGALLGSLCGEIMITWGWISPDSHILMVSLGITAFLGATSRIPLTSCVFAIEALGGTSNIFPFIIAVAVAFVIAQFSGVEDFTDTMVKAKIGSATHENAPENACK